MTLTPEDRRGFEWFLGLEQPKQEKLLSFLQDLLTELRAEWESRPENEGRTVTNSQLWQEYVRRSRERDGGGPQPQDEGG